MDLVGIAAEEGYVFDLEVAEERLEDVGLAFVGHVG